MWLCRMSTAVVMENEFLCNMAINEPLATAVDGHICTVDRGVQ